MIQCFIFDLDGVLVNTSIYHFQAWQKIALQLSIPFTEADNERLKGLSREDSLQTLLQVGGMSIGQEEAEVLLNQKNRIYLDLIAQIDESAVLPGVRIVLSRLKQSACPLVLASSSKNAKFVIQKTGLEDFFNEVVDGHQISKPKPNPEIFLTAAFLAGAQAKNCLVFEDAAAGVKAAKSAGMRCIGIGEKEPLKEADFVFSDFTRFSPEFLFELYRSV